MCSLFFFLMIRRPPRSTPLSLHDALPILRMPKSTGMGLYISGFVLLFGFSLVWHIWWLAAVGLLGAITFLDRKSTRLNSSHANISYAVFCLKKKKNS